MLQSRRNGHANEKQEQTRWKLSWRRRKKSVGRLKNPPVWCINPSKQSRSASVAAGQNKADRIYFLPTSIRTVADYRLPEEEWNDPVVWCSTGYVTSQTPAKLHHFNDINAWFDPPIDGSWLISMIASSLEMTWKCVGQLHLILQWLWKYRM